MRAPTTGATRAPIRNEFNFILLPAAAAALGAVQHKLWRADGSAGGYYTVELQWSQAQKGMEYQLIFTCRANDSWDDLSDEC